MHHHDAPAQAGKPKAQATPETAERASWRDPMRGLPFAEQSARLAPDGQTAAPVQMKRKGDDAGKSDTTPPAPEADAAPVTADERFFAVGAIGNVARERMQGLHQELGAARYLQILGAGPSGEVGFDTEVAPQKGQVPGIHLGAKNGADKAKSLDWDAQNSEIADERGKDKTDDDDRSDEPTMRAALDQQRRLELAKTFGPGVELDDVTTVMRLLTAVGESGAVAKIRAGLFQANQYALIKTLKVEKSYRYEKHSKSKTDSRGKSYEKSSTYCNVYAHDLVTAMGGYLPRVWWKGWVERRLADPDVAPVSKEEYEAAAKAGEDISKLVPIVREISKDKRNKKQKDKGLREGTVGELSADQLAQWMKKWGASFGWEHSADPELAQQTANEGTIVVAVAEAKGDDKAERGHINVIAAESKEHHHTTDKKGGMVPLSSQAGANNFEFSDSATGKSSVKSKSQWWKLEKYKKGGGFWIYRGATKSPILTPEQMGLK